ncbi:hypothetical protein TNCV_1129171 [Trichonephila clavipes]|nr:hypothetical protein TNCV_1129171 [Trichonephila clavipes]
MGINRWKAVVTDRVYWRRISESALACKRLELMKKKKGNFYQRMSNLTACITYPSGVLKTNLFSTMAEERPQ